MKLVAQQAAVAHRCFPGARMLVTGNPSAGEPLPLGRPGGDDVDIWAVLSRRYYGQYDRPREKLDLIDKARAAGKMIWSSTYTGVAGTPGYGAAEPLSDPRMFLLWNALEGIRGTLYAQGTTSYGKGNPLESLASNGEFVLVYPGATGRSRARGSSRSATASRTGTCSTSSGESAALPRSARSSRDAGLFSATAQGVELACTHGCELPGSTRYSWPRWSHDSSTAARIEAARRKRSRSTPGDGDVGAEFTPYLPLTGQCLCGARAVRGGPAPRLRRLLPLHTLPATHRQGRRLSGPRAGLAADRRGEELVGSWDPPDGCGRRSVPRAVARCGPGGADPEMSRPHGHVRRRPGLRPSYRQFTAYAAPWEPIPGRRPSPLPRTTPDLVFFFFFFF